MSKKDQPHFSKSENNSTPPVDQNPLVEELKAKLANRDEILAELQIQITSLQQQIQQNPNRPDIVAKLRNKIASSKEIASQKLQKTINFLKENKTALLASSILTLTGITGLQAKSIDSLQDQIFLNSNLNRLTDEKMIDSIETKAERKEQEFNDKIQELKREIQELKNTQSSTLLPQNSNQTANQVPQITLPQNSQNPKSQKFPVLPGYNDWVPAPKIETPQLKMPEISAPSVNPEIVPNSQVQKPIDTQPAPIQPPTPSTLEKN